MEGGGRAAIISAQSLLPHLSPNSKMIQSEEEGNNSSVDLAGKPIANLSTADVRGEALGVGRRRG